MGLPRDQEKKDPSRRKQSSLLFARVLGKRAFWGFVLITIFAAGILAATNIVSKYAIKLYAEDQLRHVPWDIVGTQADDLREFRGVHSTIAKIRGVRRVENLGLLRVQLNPNIPIEIDGQRVHLLWLSIMSASEPEVLPPLLRPRENQPILALLGPQKIIKPYLERVSAGSHINVKYQAEGKESEIFSATVGRVTQVDRQELVKWLMQEVGSAAFVPQLGIIVVLPRSDFERQVAQFDRVFRQLEVKTVYGEEVAAHDLGVSYTPEIVHLVSVHRDRLFSGWDLEGSQRRSADLVEQVRTTTIDAGFDIGVNSDLLMTLEKIIRSARLVGVASILIAIPILWMTWVFAWNWAGLIALNERRTIGLMRLRGASGKAIERGLVLSIGVGGVIGGMVGILLGTGLPLLAYWINGTDVPLGKIDKIQDPWSLGLFVVISTLLGLLAGRRVTSYANRITPHVAAGHVTASESRAFFPSLSDFQFFALVFGAYKIGAWVMRYSPQAEPFRTADGLLNFLGAPLFIYGFAAFVVSRPGIMSRLLAVLAGPISGELKWFVVEDMMARPHRIRSAALIASLMFCISFYPQLVSNSFYDRTVRGVRVSAGTDLGITFDASDFAQGEIKVQPIKAHLAETRARTQDLFERLQRVKGVDKIQVVYEAAVPGVYLPGSEGLPFYLVTDPEAYLSTVYYEDELGVGKPFGEAVRGMGTRRADVLVSQGLADLKNWNAGGSLDLGSNASGQQEKTAVSGIVSLFPGAPRMLLQNRDAYVAAEVDFINQLSRADPFVVSRTDNPALENEDALLSRIVFLVDAAEGASTRTLAADVEQELRHSARYFTIRKLEDEIGDMSKDMFVSLAIENIKVYMIGGALVALAGVLAVSLANFVHIRRTFTLLRVRGGSPQHLLRVSISDSLVPIVLGITVGVAVGILAGYGLTDQLLKISSTFSFLQKLPIHLTFSTTLFVVLGLLCLFFALTAVAFGLWIFRRTAREMLHEA